MAKDMSSSTAAMAFMDGRLAERYRRVTWQWACVIRRGRNSNDETQ
jgi:hypothetical protein